VGHRQLVLNVPGLPAVIGEMPYISRLSQQAGAEVLDGVIAAGGLGLLSGPVGT
jgi:hypothetical protein